MNSIHNLWTSVKISKIEKMKIDENWWKLMKLDENWWNLMKLDKTWWKLMNLMNVHQFEIDEPSVHHQKWWTDEFDELFGDEPFHHSSVMNKVHPFIGLFFVADSG